MLAKIFSIPKYWPKSQDFALSFLFAEFPLMPWLHTQQKNQVGSGWRACDHSVLLPCQRRPDEGRVTGRWARAQLGAEWPGRGRVSSSLPHPLRPLGGALTPAAASIASHKIPRGLALQDMSGLWLLHRQPGFCHLPWDHPQGRCPRASGFSPRHQTRASRLRGRY